MITVEFKFENGQKVRDRVSGLTGIIDSSCLCLNGCKKYTVQPPVKEGESTKPDSWWMDEESLELLELEPVIPQEEVQRGVFSTRGPSSKTQPI